MASQFIERKSFGFLRYPRVDTYNIVMQATKVFDYFRINNQLTIKNAFHKMISYTLRNINISALFANFDIHTQDIVELLGIMENHKFMLIKSMLHLFLKSKCFIMENISHSIYTILL